MDGRPQRHLAQPRVCCWAVPATLRSAAAPPPLNMARPLPACGLRRYYIKRFSG